MTREEAKHKLDFMKKAYQKLIDEKVDSGKLVGDGVRGEWKAEAPLDEVYKDMIEALDMAIKALEQQQRDCNTCKHSDNGNCAYTEECHECMWKSKYEKQPCDDCISREAVDEYITNLLSGYLYDEERTRLEELTAYIWELPSVQPTRTTGKWIVCDVVKFGDFVGTEKYECSKCHHRVGAFKSNFCPNCGARMEEEA